MCSLFKSLLRLLFQGKQSRGCQKLIKEGLGRHGQQYLSHIIDKGGWLKEFGLKSCFVLFFVCFFTTAEAREELDLRPIPQDLLLRSSLYLHSAGRRVQVRQRQLESHPIHKRGGFQPKAPVRLDPCSPILGNRPGWSKKKKKKAVTQKCIH